MRETSFYLKKQAERSIYKKSASALLRPDKRWSWTVFKVQKYILSYIIKKIRIDANSSILKMSYV
ncbi:hypothetical protein C0966_14255 [Bacillus methanolicus]|nr:hypothetical protein [Bacillus methanolicus]